MPRIKQIPTPFERVRRLLLGYELTATKLAIVLKCSQPTARQRLNDPGLLRLTELRKLHRLGHIPIAELMEVIRREL